MFVKRRGKIYSCRECVLCGGFVIRRYIAADVSVMMCCIEKTFIKYAL